MATSSRTALDTFAPLLHMSSRSAVWSIIFGYLEISDVPRYRRVNSLWRTVVDAYCGMYILILDSDSMQKWSTGPVDCVGDVLDVEKNSTLSEELKIEIQEMGRRVRKVRISIAAGGSVLPATAVPATAMPVPAVPATLVPPTVMPVLTVAPTEQVVEASSLTATSGSAGRSTTIHENPLYNIETIYPIVSDLRASEFLSDHFGTLRRNGYITPEYMKYFDVRSADDWKDLIMFERDFAHGFKGASGAVDAMRFVLDELTRGQLEELSILRDDLKGLRFGGVDALTLQELRRDRMARQELQRRSRGPERLASRLRVLKFTLGSDMHVHLNLSGDIDPPFPLYPLLQKVGWPMYNDQSSLSKNWLIRRYRALQICMDVPLLREAAVEGLTPRAFESCQHSTRLRPRSHTDTAAEPPMPNADRNMTAPSVTALTLSSVTSLGTALDLLSSTGIDNLETLRIRRLASVAELIMMWGCTRVAGKDCESRPTHKLVVDAVDWKYLPIWREQYGPIIDIIEADRPEMIRSWKQTEVTPSQLVKEGIPDETTILNRLIPVAELYIIVASTCCRDEEDLMSQTHPHASKCPWDRERGGAQERLAIRLRYRSKTSKARLRHLLKRSLKMRRSDNLSPSRRRSDKLSFAMLNTRMLISGLTDNLPPITENVLKFLNDAGRTEREGDALVGIADVPYLDRERSRRPEAAVDILADASYRDGLRRRRQEKYVRLCAHVAHLEGGERSRREDDALGGLGDPSLDGERGRRQDDSLGGLADPSVNGERRRRPQDALGILADVPYLDGGRGGKQDDALGGLADPFLIGERGRRQDNALGSLADIPEVPENRDMFDYPDERPSHGLSGREQSRCFFDFEHIPEAGAADREAQDILAQQTVREDPVATSSPITENMRPCEPSALDLLFCNMGILAILKEAYLYLRTSSNRIKNVSLVQLSLLDFGLLDS